MKKDLVSILTVVAGLALAVPVKAERIYQLIDYPAIENGHTLSGTITTSDDAPADGILNTAEILDWQWTITGPHSYSAMSSSPVSPGFVPIRVIGAGISEEAIRMPLNSDADLLLQQNLSTSTGRGSQLLGVRWLNVFETLSSSFRRRYSAGLLEGDVENSFWSVEFPVPADSLRTVAILVPEPSSISLGIVVAVQCFSVRAERKNSSQFVGRDVILLPSAEECS